MGGCAEEVYVAQCEMGKLALLMMRSHEEVARSLLDAWHMRPTRAEALWCIAQHCRLNQRFAEGPCCLFSLDKLLDHEAADFCYGSGRAVGL